ncbi:MAG: nitrate reductase [Methylocystis sp.]|uniref:nitrate reductase n=1 Tax=Methylocystis sp. TaxID=1911079 RepID=UPI003DA658FD
MFEDTVITRQPSAAAPPPSTPAVATRTTCPYCGVGCGVLASPDGKGGARISGDPDHPANFGRLCSKGSALGETLATGERLLFPLRRQPDGGYARIDWDAALDEVAARFSDIAARHGPQAVGVYLSGQLLTEDYYVANKLMKGFIGSSNVDTNSRLCMASSVAGHKRAFGADTVPGCYEDLDCADLVVFVGSNAAWCHPVLFQRVMRNRETRGAKMVVIDTRRTATSDSADLFLQIAPGMDQALFSGLLAHLAQSGALDEDYIRRCTSGFEAARDAARRLTPNIAATAAATGLRDEEVAAFFRLFAATPRVVTAFSQGVNQSAQGTDKVNAILNCHLATGRIGQPGAGPFSLTGQPNAMGGREVGGLANSLAAHMGFEAENVDRLRRFWGAPRMATGEGRKAVDMFHAVARGEIKALWIACTNPAASLPDADAMRAALGRLDFLVVSDTTRATDTTLAGAHLLLPAQGWGEKNGTVTNSERRISRQRGFLPAPGAARPDWAIFAGVARRMGFSGFDYRSAADVFREHAALSAFENDGRRDFDIGGLAQASDDAYAALAPVQWPVRAGEKQGRARLFGAGGFYTPDRRARFVAPAAPALAARVSDAFPLRLNTGRVRDQWHTMTRSGVSPRLALHLPEPFVEIHPDDAAAAGLADAGFARVTTAQGACVLRVRVTDRQPRGQIFAPIHWTDATSAQARVGALVAPHVDPVSGQPESKATPAAIAPHVFARQGFLLTRRPLRLARDGVWTRVAVPCGVAYRLASDATDADWRETLSHGVPGADCAEFVDSARGLYRAAAFVAGRPERLLFLGTEPESWESALALFALEAPGPAQRLALLSGRAAGEADDSALVCACFGVRAARIEAAIAEGCDAGEIGRRTRAGTNCGSCAPEIARMIARRRGEG